MSLHPPRIVQLSAAAGSLAVVFGPDDDDDDEEEPAQESRRTPATGPEVFADFKAQNMRSFWNRRLVRAMGEVRFQGWMDNLVLLIRGSAASLEVLREAWMRRALKSAAGFVIRAVGDLSPLQMSPVPQSQFIPLAEVLCSVISDMNSSQIIVSQETLVNHMSRSHPGITIPTQDILYNTLGTLIKERKIYHTGEGYFIVTPQTYFISSNMAREKSWWTSDSADDPPSPPPITYLLSNDIRVESTQTAHCKSCSCFSPLLPVAGDPAANLPSAAPDQHSVSVSVSECTAKSLKWPRPLDQKTSVQHQSTSTAADCQASEVGKTAGTINAVSRKEKDNKPGRKFGLSLFRRNGGKKEKPKKEYAAFSGQFPPEEWPVRDEDDLNNLPRDLEHAIIKRINPELTVDNLTRHTVLMKKLEERREKAADKGVDKGMSTDILTSSKPRHHHHHSRPAKKSAQKSSRSKWRVHSSREKQRERIKNKLAVCANAYPDREDLIPTRLPVEIPIDEPGKVEDGLDGISLYKKRIENPFHAPETGNLPAAVSWEQRKPKEGRLSGRKERTCHRSKPWDSHQTKLGVAEAEHTAKSTTSQDKCDQERDANCDRLSRPDLKLCRELPPDYSSSYPQSCTLRIDDKIRRRIEGGGAESWENPQLKDGRNQTLDNGLADVHQDASSNANLTQAWLKSSLQRKHSLRLHKTQDSQNLEPLSTRQYAKDIRTVTDTKGQGTVGVVVEPEVDDLPPVTDTDDDYRLYQRADRRHDEDTCSSLCLNEEDIIPKYLNPRLVYHQYDTESKRQESRSRYYDSSSHHQQVSSIDSHSITQREASLSPSRPEKTTWGRPHPQQSPVSPQEEPSSGKEALVQKGLHEASLDSDHPGPLEAFDSSIFDYSPASEVESDAETVRKSPDEGDGESARRAAELKEEQDHETGVSRTPGGGLSGPRALENGDAVENHSFTGDSGIDSPRTHVSLASSNTVILEGLKRRGFLQNLDKLHPKSGGIRPQNSLLQLTPVMNV
ncbi:storkhead-box protein 1 [Syngnathoides biaculeatus]|uniref:storkhead-box protein 1 n=1 Tax=Syngnathoides biaculeatus TaxID=300417 RepID=UPI002ADD7700|nr:storkhead-box protein 1 [Syngnathoides biaculeatus]